MAITKKRLKNGVETWTITFNYWVHPVTGEPVPHKAIERCIVKKREPDYMTLAAAKKGLARRKAEAWDGIYRDEEREQKRMEAAHAAAHGEKFRELAERFLRDYRGRDGRPRSTFYKQNVARLNLYFGDMYLRDITRANVEDYARTETVGPSTLKKRLTSLKTIFNTAVDWGAMESNPASRVRKPSEPKGRREYLTEPEFSRLLDAAPAYLVPMFRIAVAQGLRLKEVTGLRWGDVDRAGGHLYVNPDSKTARPDPVRLTADARVVLEAAEKRHGEVCRKVGKLVPWVFVKDDGEPHHSDLSRNAISVRTKNVMGKIGRPSCSFHTLRHTCASWLVQRGVDLLKVKEIMRHKNIETTMRYAHLAPEHMSDAVAAMDAAMASAVDTARGPERNPNTVNG